jgi:hypothetical protein
MPQYYKTSNQKLNVRLETVFLVPHIFRKYRRVSAPWESIKVVSCIVDTNSFIHLHLVRYLESDILLFIYFKPNTWSLGNWKILINSHVCHFKAVFTLLDLKRRLLWSLDSFSHLHRRLLLWLTFRLWRWSRYVPPKLDWLLPDYTTLYTRGQSSAISILNSEIL